MRQRVYIETTIVSYLTARHSQDLIVAAHQQITREWWQTQRDKFDLFVSQLVIREVSVGDEEVAHRRVEALEGVPLLELNQEALLLAEDLIARGPLPRKAAEDALHIAIATVHGMDYLLTWNCKHIANAKMRSQIESICRSRGYEPSIICTAEELLEE
ncbi:MAG TPA: type II toxin-antitoxin system VapC family toxin [Ardenticatenaceae bacterium]|jgi:predicted nucleic acid-binding protein